ncbi:hypothetical protein HRI_003755600 [Hibiscus trionum]|uniref:C2H2-type domain-containing protein n=1 Tax=Hibiscus trionum TaxID=183268 RepID=A0A9W7MGD3_HIBTR|nr:hypothetical protein HRI_003755600 [Hibiscus trionum]
MDDQATTTMGTSDSAPLKPNKLTLKLKISKKIGYGGAGGGNHHICPVCSKGFTSGKALGGHIRIHMKGNKASRHRKIPKRQPRSGTVHRGAKSKNTISNTAASPDDDPKRDTDEKVSCCICNKGFRSMKSLFGHMRNHPERSWRGIRPPPSDKNSCCSSVSENDEAHEVDQVKGSNSDLLKSLPRWNTNTSKLFDDDEIPEAAYCLMKLSRGDSFHKTPLKLEEERVYYQKPGFYFCPKNPNGEQFSKPSDHKSSKVCSSKTLLDFDLNEPYVEGFDNDQSSI